MSTASHRAYTVIKREGKEDFWHNMGLVFPHGDGEGLPSGGLTESTVAGQPAQPGPDLVLDPAGPIRATAISPELHR